MPHEKLIEKLYDDIAHPSAKVIGETMRHIIEHLFGVEPNKRRYNLLKKNVPTYVQKITKKLRAEKTFNKKPRLNITTPILDQMSITGGAKLNEMFAELLAKECTMEESSYVLPAFVELLKNLSSDEAKILEQMKKDFSFTCHNTDKKVHLKGHIPVVKILGNNADETHLEVQWVYTDAFDSLPLDHKENIPVYLSNLKRIGCIDILFGQFEGGIIAGFPYDSYFKKKSYIQNQEEEIKKSDRHIGLEPGRISVTELGKKFLDAVSE